MAQEARKIVIFSTRGNQITEVVSTATTYGELVKEAGLEVDTLTATESVRRTTLSHFESQLPEGDFTLYLRPSKTKAGAVDFSSMSFRETKDYILANADAKAFLNDKAKGLGKNWTQLTSSQRVEFLTEYQNSVAVNTEEVVEENATINAADVVESVEQNKTKEPATITVDILGAIADFSTEDQIGLAVNILKKADLSAIPEDAAEVLSSILEDTEALEAEMGGFDISKFSIVLTQVFEEESEEVRKAREKAEEEARLKAEEEEAERIRKEKLLEDLQEGLKDLEAGEIH